MLLLRFRYLPPADGIVYVPYGDDHWEGLNDQMVVGDVQTLIRHTGWSVGSDGVKPERTLADYLAKHKIGVVRFWYEYALLRPRDVALLAAVSPPLFVAFNHNAHIWGKVVSSARASSMIVHANTSCTVVSSTRHVEIPRGVPCQRVRVPFSCARPPPSKATLERVVCASSRTPLAEELAPHEARSTLCFTGDDPPHVVREAAFIDGCHAATRCRDGQDPVVQVPTRRGAAAGSGVHRVDYQAIAFA